MSKYRNLPSLTPPAARLLYICLAVLAVYLLGVALYAGYTPAGAGRTAVFVDSVRRDNAFALLYSAYLSSVLAGGGVLLLDLDARTAARR